MRQRGISTTVAVGVILALVVVGAGAFFLLQPGPQGTSTTGSTTTSGTTSSTTTSGTTSSTTTSGTTSSTTLAVITLDVNSAVNQHLAGVTARNVQSLLQDYSNNALVVWSGQAQGLQGNYSGQGNIGFLYSAAFGTAETLNLKSSNIAQTVNQPTLKTVALGINITGTSQVLGNFNATVTAQVTYQFASGSWKISQEVWNFKVFDAQNSAGETTFPEWRTVGGPIEETRSPNPFKQFVWDVGGEAMTILIFACIGAMAVMVAARRVRT